MKLSRVRVLYILPFTIPSCELACLDFDSHSYLKTVIIITFIVRFSYIDAFHAIQVVLFFHHLHLSTTGSYRDLSMPHLISVHLARLIRYIHLLLMVVSCCLATSIKEGL